MSLRSELRKLGDLVGVFSRAPRPALRILGQLPRMVDGFSFGRDVAAPLGPHDARRPLELDEPNALRQFFDRRQAGRGIWKWEHYFEIYDQHLRRFVGGDVGILEIGVYSGGSLEMWREYLGERCRVYGVDLQPECRCYENEYTKIYIGDQADRGFWESFKRAEPSIDILIDDGGHRAEQQIATLEAMLPHLQPGGVYLCEDVHGVNHSFSAYVYGLAKHLNAMLEHGTPSPLQQLVKSVHFYPFVTVIERSELPVAPFSAPKRGTEWQPFKT